MRRASIPGHVLAACSRARAQSTPPTGSSNASFSDVPAGAVKSPLYVLHVMSRAASEVVAAKRRDAIRSECALYGEVVACALRSPASRSNSNLLRDATSPPMPRDERTATGLIKMLASDDLQVTGSDNCTFNESQKALGAKDFTKIPNGVNGVEDRMSVIWERGVHAGLMDPQRYVAVTSTNAARIFNLYPRKGCIAEGSDADILILNPTKTRVISAKTHHQAVDYNIFEGMECHGVPEYVIVNGRVCVDEGDLKVVEGHGTFVETPCHAPFVYETPQGSIAAVNDMTQQLQIDVPPSNGHHEPLPPAGAPAYARSPYALSPALSFAPSLADSTVSSTGKAPRQEGQRNLQDSTFSISEELDGGDRRSCIRVKNPPGGKSSGFW
ncbi:dihydropyrimidinase-like [Ctenocephalides felis]|uniref:dihydropyrimidinase-like n=1 Tax=Ctenocephalides felis TaxID=7515 RepID=UPI000E6E335D|nr:dihydropyrimidinase-like [Ctenocephalides felis]